MSEERPEKKQKVEVDDSEGWTLIQQGAEAVTRTHPFANTCILSTVLVYEAAYRPRRALRLHAKASHTLAHTSGCTKPNILAERLL